MRAMPAMPLESPCPSCPPQPFVWERANASAMGRYLTAQELAFVRQALADTPTVQRVLDACCGDGRMARPLHAAGYTVVGVDPDPVALAAFRRHSTTMPLLQGDAQRLPIADASVDAVMAIQCLLYLDYRCFLAECARVLRDGGVLVYSMLNPHSYKWALKRLAGHLRGVDPARTRSLAVMRRTLRAEGFVVQALQGYNWLPFTRESESPLLGWAAGLEQRLPLARLAPVSPWVLVAARKQAVTAPGARGRPARAGSATPPARPRGLGRGRHGEGRGAPG